MPIPHPTLRQNPCSTMAGLDAWMIGSWTSLHMTNGYVVTAENKNHKIYPCSPLVKSQGAFVFPKSIRRKTNEII